MVHVFPSLDNCGRFLCGSPYSQEDGGVMSSSGESNSELNIEECKFQTLHPLSECMVPGTGGFRIPQDGWGRMECIVRPINDSFTELGDRCP